MDGNKDEAVKCVRIGKEALGSGDRARALKFFSKARRLDPNLPIDDLLSTASGDGESQNHPSPDDSAAPFDGPQPEMRSSSSSSSFAASASTAKVRPSSDGSSRSYTEEQVSIVRQIKKQKDYYQILGLEKGCTVEDVRKAYRKLSLKVHPDKNQAPGAEEAFKAVSKAFQCLSDDESRKRYDLVGTDEPSYSRAPTRHRSHGFDGFYEADFDADEIFRNFFGGMAPATTFHFRTGNMGARGMRESGNSNLRMLIQILPVIILLLLNFLPSSDPIYSLSRSYPYEQKLQTPKGVNYFVKPSKFEEDYPIQSPERIALEQRVEREYIGILTQNCRAELQRRHFGLSYQTPYCDMLQKFET